MGHTNAVYSVAWSADERLASSSGDNTVIIWDLETSRPAQTLTGLTSFTRSMAWSADGRLASGLWDNSIKIIRADLISGDTCNSIFRNMTFLEWFQGSFSIYRPACSNLYNPTENIMNNLSGLRDLVISDWFKVVPEPIAILIGYFLIPVVAPLYMLFMPSINSALNSAIAGSFCHLAGPCNFIWQFTYFSCYRGFYFMGIL